MKSVLGYGCYEYVFPGETSYKKSVPVIGLIPHHGRTPKISCLEILVGQQPVYQWASLYPPGEGHNRVWGCNLSEGRCSNEEKTLLARWVHYRFFVVFALLYRC